MKTGSTISIPERTTAIDSQAIQNCMELTAVVIPGSVTTIGGFD